MQPQEKIEFLRKSPIFSTLNPTELLDLSKYAIECSLEPNEFLIHEGDSCKYFYILVDGKLRIFLYSSLGKELTLITFFRSGDVLGPTSVFRDRPSSGSIQALTDTRVLRFKKEDIVSFILNHPQVSLEIIKVLAARVSELNRRLRDVVGERAEQRLLRAMLALSHRYGTTLNITRHELAEMIGVTTETVIRILSSLKKMRIIASVRGKITIIDEARLRSLSEGPF
jgi:CRP/FNR family transcriptional regulator